jgi:hypothetical protein
MLAQILIDLETFFIPYKASTGWDIVFALFVLTQHNSPYIIARATPRK